MDPHEPSAEIRVPGATRLAEGETLLFTCTYQGRAREGFILLHEAALYAYLNECPHWAVELDLGDGHFFDEQLERIYCKNHGALFHPKSGVCETGPCLGRALTRFPVRVEEGDAVVQLEEILA